jgi:hypothetical protein
VRLEGAGAAQRHLRCADLRALYDIAGAGQGSLPRTRRRLGGLEGTAMTGPRALVDALRESEDRALRDLSRQFASCSGPLTSALRAAYRRALADTGVARSVILQLEQRDRT